MSVINCNECGQEYSNTLNACPNCGCPNIKKTNEKNALNVNKSSIIGGIVAAVIILIPMLFIASQGGFKEKIDVKGNTMYEYLNILEKYGRDIDLDSISVGANCYTGIQTTTLNTKRYGKVVVDFSYCKSSNSVYIHIYN